MTNKEIEDYLVANFSHRDVAKRFLQTVPRAEIEAEAAAWKEHWKQEGAREQAS